ncbi:gas vesicle structural protein GvpA [Archangium lipolyticum]|uniref:gas vesicle structural protein GvpA n=1 Tax=Archangium lipolyticum TaxID=2970465 RepID=UPI00214A4A87|nr:gas vesicle structural protein GvpA [Archangium lipolyticum]
MANIQKSTDSSSLAEVVSIILDKGIVIDVWATVSLVGIQLLAVEARVVIASVETYLKYAAAIGLTGGTQAAQSLKNAALPVATSVAMPAMPGAAIPAPAM